jgi:molybdopterin-containing oxidoreductase family iron-sulfur binding subunit
MSESWKLSAADPRLRILEALGPEFAAGADLPPDEPTRRRFLQIMGASVALAGAGGCINQPQETIVPYVHAPEKLIPGKPLYYATAMTHAGASLGLLVETHMGRPVKVEGNPLHPAVPEVMAKANESAPSDQLRFGATDAFAQAAVLSLYDPDRSQTVLRQGQIDTWESCYTELRRQLDELAPSGGEGLRILTEPVVSPTLAGQLQQVLTKFPSARWHQYEPIQDDNALLGARLAFGEDLSVVYRDPPDVVLSLDADCFSDGPFRLQLARLLRSQYAGTQNPRLTRLYVVETSRTITGAVADHRLALSPPDVVRFAMSVAQSFGLQTGGDTSASAGAVPQEWLDAVVADLAAARGRSLVIAGRNQPPVVHAVAHWLNVTLGNVGSALEYQSPVTDRPDLSVESIRGLASAMSAGEVKTLVILGGNPAYDAPADLSFAAALAKVPFSLHLSPYADETSVRCTWHVPETHLFESWTDTRAGDATVSIVQPLIAPLYDGKSTHELLAALLGIAVASSHEIVQEHWQQAFNSTSAGEFDRIWKTALHDGIIRGTASEVRTPKIRSDFGENLSEAMSLFRASPSDGPLHIVFRPDASTWDGRFANSGWLQELPRPFTNLTWDNAALMSPRTAEEHEIATGDVIEIESGDRRIEIPAFVVPGHPRETITLHLGYGRQRAGRVGDNIGVDAYPLRTTDKMWFAEVTALRKTGRTYPLATTQHHHRMDGRPLVRAGTLKQYETAPEHPVFMADSGHGAAESSMYPEPRYDGYKWGMVVNQSACVGCNACVIACQAENNIPVVGKDQVARGREMHWLRIDNYYAGDNDNPTVYHQPRLCMHCEYAPCEPVCPVAATTHSDEGLNEMTYNRCIGTRYCSNNCPYKVRRFNFFDYNVELREDPTMQLRPNPDVTIRSRGVMEKCTYCVQRINATRIAAGIDNRQIRDGEILTACQAACPTQALTFGNLNDAESAVRTLADSSLNYSLLGELNTRPRTTYLAVVRNPNPALETG